MTATMAKVEAVKLSMQDNIQQALANCVTLERIEENAGKVGRRRHLGGIREPLVLK